MNKLEKTILVPTLRFLEFQNEQVWTKEKIGKYLKESKIKGSKGNIAKKLTVKLWGKGVYEKKEILQGSKNTQYFHRKSGQFIYSKLDFLNQAFGIIPKHLDGYESTADLPCFDIKEGLDANFLLEYVQRKSFYKKYGEMADGGRKAKRIQPEVFFEFLICLPKLSEQQKIADCLSSLDDLISAEDKKLEALKAHKKGLMQKLFPCEGKTVPEWRFPEFRESGEWSEKKLGSKSIKVGSGSTPLGGEDNYKRSGRPFIRSQNVGWGCLILDDIVFIDESTHQGLSATEVHSGDTLLNITGASIGRSAVADYRVDGGNINQHVCIIRTKIDELNPYFLNHYLLSMYGQKQIKIFQAGGNRLGLNFAQIRSFSVPIPSIIEEQQKIANCLSSIDDLITEQTQRIEMLKQHKKGLIQGLFPSIEEVGE